MPFLWNKEISSYVVEVFHAPSLGYDRSIRMTSTDGHTISVTFPSVAPADYVSIGTSFHQIKMSKDRFDTVYHLLQTEKPLYFTAYETDGANPIRFAGLSTSSESVGEGLVDANAAE